MTVPSKIWVALWTYKESDEWFPCYSEPFLEEALAKSYIDKRKETGLKFSIVEFEAHHSGRGKERENV